MGGYVCHGDTEEKKKRHRVCGWCEMPTKCGAVESLTSVAVGAEWKKI